MSKRTATRELTHDNWEAEEEREDMGTFRQASEEQMAGRAIRKAKRRGTNGETGTSSVFKGLSVFSSFSTTSASSAPPAFSFLSSVSKDSPENSLSKVNSNSKSETTLEKASQPLKLTQDSALPGVKGSESKSNGFMEAKDDSEGESKKESFFLSNLKALNEGVLLWIQKHLDKNPHVNLTPVFDDYKKHFSELRKKYPPELGSSKDSDSGATTNGSKKDAASEKENTPVVPEVSKDSAPVKPFTFGIQSSSTEKSSESAKSIFTFGSNSSDTDKKSNSAPTFSFSGFGSSNSPKSEGLVFGNSNKTSSSSTGSLFGGFNSSSGTKTNGGGGFSFSSGTSVAPATEKKNEQENADDPSDEPPKVEVNVVQEEDALYEKKCKLFYLKDGSYVDRGVGTLYLKSVGEKTQLLVRAYTNLGNILLNIILNSSIPTVRAGKNGVILACVPNPPLETNAEKSKEPVKMLVKVKTSEDADTLLKKLEEYKK